MLIPEVSPTAGQVSDGMVLGTVDETLLVAEMQTVERCLSPVIYRLDRSTGSLAIIEDTTNAISTTPNAFTPFNSDGDGLAINCEEAFQGVLLKIDTAGVYAGTVTLSVKDSIDGVWASNPLTVTDNTSRFTLTGWHYITIPDNANRKAFKLSNDPDLATPSGKYISIRLDGLQAGDTMPKISNVTLIRKTFRWEENTDDVNGDTATAPPADMHYPWPGSKKRWCFSNPAYGMEAFMHLIQTNVITDAHRVLNSAGEWVSATGWSNATNDFTTGPTVLGNPVQKLAIRWDILSTWGSVAQTFTLDDGSTITRTGYWIEEETLSVTSYGDHQEPRYRLRARQYGDMNTSGGEVLVAKTLLGVTLRGIAAADTPAVDTLVRAVNLSTGVESSVFTISAADIALLLQGVPRTYDTTDLLFAAGNREPAYRCVSGGALRNVDLQEIF